MTARPRSGHGSLHLSAWAPIVLSLCGVTALGCVCLASRPTPALSPARASNQILSTVNGAASASVNWSGYAATGATFTNVAGSWTQPTATCPSNTSQLAAFWVGIDGYSANDPNPEQIGTDSDCTKGKGNGKGGANGPNKAKGGGGNGKGGGKGVGGPIYYGWYEFSPQPPVFLSTSAYPVVPGDDISAQVAASGSTFTLTLTNATQGWTFTTNENVSPMPPEASAEWIAESPQACAKKNCGNAQLTDFGSLSFSGASANGQGISSPSFVDHAITMEKRKGKVVRASPSALSVDGSAFNVTWEHS